MKLVFGDPASIRQRDLSRLEGAEWMRATQGATADKCGNCRFLLNGRNGKRCSQYADLRPDGRVSWRLKWDACGLFERRQD